MNAAATALLLVALGLPSFAQTTKPRPAPVISPEVKADHSATFRLKAPNAKVVARREFGKALARLELLFCRAFEANRWRDALAAQVELNRLMGFDNAQKVEPGIMDPVHGVSVVCYLPDNGRATDSPNPIIPHTGE